TNPGPTKNPPPPRRLPHPRARARARARARPGDVASPRRWTSSSYSTRSGGPAANAAHSRARDQRAGAPRRSPILVHVLVLVHDPATLPRREGCPGSRPGRRAGPDGVEHALDERVHGVALDPAGHDHEVVLRVHVDDVLPGAAVGERGLGRLRPGLAAGVQEVVHEAVVRLD